MATQTCSGKCRLCGGTFSRAAMTRHLQACGRPAAPAEAKSFHLFVGQRPDKTYWLHLAVPPDASLEALDRFLRDIWLECCGHMSAFTIAGLRYARRPMDDLPEKSMRTPVHRVLRTGLGFDYEYDFGSTTELTLKVVGLREGKTRGGKIQLLARNEAPQVACDACHTRPATQICTECQWSDGGWYCERCAADHECGPDMLLPVVNSPRAGVCAYTG